MEWGTVENRIAVLALHRVGKSPTEIHNLLKTLPITKRFVYRTVQRFNETNDVYDRPRDGRPRSVRLPNVVNAVRARVYRNPLRKQRVLAREIGVSTRSMSRILRDDLHLGAFRRSTGHLLTEKLKEIRKIRSKKLLKKYGKEGYKKILFTDEKIFSIEEKFNKQNDRIYAKSYREAKSKVPRVQRGHHPLSVMVWWGVSYDGVTKIHFCEKGVKTGAKVYEESVLESVVKPLNSTLFEDDFWIFQQDSAPAHKARRIQQWLRDNVPEFIAAEDWPSGSPDLNPLDYKLWDVLEASACKSRHHSLDGLKKSIVDAARKMPLSIIRASIDDWPKRLKLCYEAGGGHFE